MLKISTLIFWIVYPPLIALSTSPLVLQEFPAGEQVMRHGLVWCLACLSLIYRKKVFGIKEIRLAALLSATATTIAVVFWIIKLSLFEGLNYSALYASFGYAVFILAAAVASYSLFHYGHLKVFFMGTLLSLVTLTFLHYLQGEQMVSDVYGRTRMILGFVHPGKLSHLFAVLAVIVIVGRLDRDDFRLSSRSFWMFTIFFVLVALTSTRTTVIILLILLVGRILDRLSYTGQLSLKSIIMFSFMFLTIYSFFAFDYSQSNAIASGRLQVWANSISLNLKIFGSSMMLIGSTEDPTAAYWFFLEGVRDQPLSFRVDNGFLEIFILHGALVFILLSFSILVLLRRTKNDTRAIILGLSLLAFYLGESGLFEIGGWFGFFLTVVLFYSLRTAGYRDLGQYSRKETIK